MIWGDGVLVFLVGKIKKYRIGKRARQTRTKSPFFTSLLNPVSADAITKPTGWIPEASALWALQSILLTCGRQGTF